EDQNYAAREYTLKLDDVINEQRNVIYKLRDQILEREDLDALIYPMVTATVDEFIEKHCPDHLLPEEWDLDELVYYLQQVLPTLEPFEERPEDIQEVKEHTEEALTTVKERIEKM